MRTYRKVLRGDYISCVAIGEYGEEITEEEYSNILEIIRTAPTPPDGYAYKLCADTMEWELVELPTRPDPDPEEELTESEVYEILFGGAE